MALTTSHLWLCSALHRNMVSKEAIVTALKQEARNPCDLLASFPGTFFPCSWVPGNEASDLRISIRATDELYCYMNHISPSPPTGRISVGVTHDLLTLWVCKGTRWGAGGSRDCSCPRRSKKPSALHLTNSLQRSQTTKSCYVAFCVCFQPLAAREDVARTKKKKVILSKQAKRRMADRTSKCCMILTNLTLRLLYLVACWEWACV